LRLTQITGLEIGAQFLKIRLYLLERILVILRIGNGGYRQFEISMGRNPKLQEI